MVKILFYTSFYQIYTFNLIFSKVLIKCINVIESVTYFFFKNFKFFKQVFFTIVISITNYYLRSRYKSISSFEIDGINNTS